MPSLLSFSLFLNFPQHTKTLREFLFVFDGIKRFTSLDEEKSFIPKSRR